MTEILAPPAEVTLAGAVSFAVARHLSLDNGLPFLDWTAVRQWIETIPEAERRPVAWARCERAWLDHLRSSLGPDYSILQDGETVLLSSLESPVARATLGFIAKTQKRVLAVLDGVARVSEPGKNTLIVFDDDDAYYRYVSHYYPQKGEFAQSGGMYIDAGCGHFVTVKSDLRAMEPVIAHELTHRCVSHLPLPAWLNEGVAVNTEQRLSPPPRPLFTPQQMHDKHRRFWGEAQIQEFWSGRSFLRSDDGNMLSYDLARIIVAQLGADWAAFRSFMLDANLDDAGAKAAARHLGVELGAVVCALLERKPAPSWAPNPAAWQGTPERGAF